MATAVAAERAEVERCLASGDQARAQQLSARLLQAAPDDVELKLLHASALMLGGHWREAAPLLQAARSLPQLRHVANARLALCWRSLGDDRAAVGASREALAAQPGDFVQRLALGESLQRLGEDETALPELFRALFDAQAQRRWLNDATTPAHLRGRVRRAMEVIDGGRRQLFEQVLAPHQQRHGHAAMARVERALAVFLGLQAPPPSDPRQRPKFFWMPDLAPTPYFARAQLPWQDVLEAATADIRAELSAVLEDAPALTPFLGPVDPAAVEDIYLGGDARTRSWDAYFLHRHGQPFTDHLSRCPRTAQALTQVPLSVVRDHAPEVLFSVLAPDTHIKPHYGVTNTRVVTHLPLVIPAGDCRLVVGGMEHAWQQGRCVTFDDTFLHEAWNRSGERRVVMILDTWHPDLAPEECAALRDLIESIGDFNVRAGVR